MHDVDLTTILLFTLLAFAMSFSTILVFAVLLFIVRIIFHDTGFYNIVLYCISML